MIHFNFLRALTNYFSRSFILAILAMGCLVAGPGFADELFVSGTYQDSTGNQYLVSGGAPALGGRAQWTVTSTVPRAGTTNRFNAIWETGAAVGNTYLSGYTSIASAPSNFPVGKSYGLSSDNNFGFTWSEGSLISASQVGTTLLISQLDSFSGVTNASFTLTFIAAGGASNVTSTTFQPGTYQDARGNKYLISGGAPSLSGRAQWTITSTVPLVGTTNRFNAIWETGAAAGNTYLSGFSSVVSTPNSFLGGRSYGLSSDNNFGFTWGEGSLISASQVGTTLLISQLSSSSGGTNASFTLTFIAAGCFTASPSDNFLAGNYKDSSGNQYQLSGPSAVGSRNQWSIASTTPAIAGTSNIFNAGWETGPAIGNSYTVGFQSIVSTSGSFLSGRSYGLSSNNNFGFTWSPGSLISASQVGSTLLISQLSSTNGSTNASFAMTKTTYQCQIASTVRPTNVPILYFLFD